MSDTLIISHDQSFVEQLRHVLEQQHGRCVHVANSFREAAVILERQVFEIIFLDVRKSLTGESPSVLWQHIGPDSRRRTPVIAIADDGYVCDWAAVADLTVSGHLQLPLDNRQIAELLQGVTTNSLSRAASLPTSPRVVHGETLAYKTYTSSMFRLIDDLVTMATHDVTILLVGETGTGKTTLARLIHELSSRNGTRFLDVACGALAPELIESELFGHVKGAFTSADHAKPGKFEAAAEGSLLLDEIDVLGMAQQAKLLRVIETGEFEPVGSNETRTSKARLIVASNIDLKHLMERSQFRADLYYRLSMLECHIPPLRERLNDIVPLTLDFVKEFCTAHDIEIRRIHPDFLTCLKAYHWPGNIRELKNHVRRAVLFCRTGMLTPKELAPQFRQSQLESPSVVPGSFTMRCENMEGESLSAQIAKSERDILEQALQKNNGNRTATAQFLGMSRVGLYKKMKKHGLIVSRDGSRHASIGTE